MWQSSHTWMSCVHCRRIQGRGTCIVRNAVATHRIASSSSGRSRRPVPIRVTIISQAGEETAYDGRNEVPRLLVRTGWRSTFLLVRRQQVLNGQQDIIALWRLTPRLIERALAHCASFSNMSRLLSYRRHFSRPNVGHVALFHQLEVTILEDNVNHPFGWFLFIARACYLEI